MFKPNFDLSVVADYIEDAIEPDFQLMGIKTLAPNEFYVEASDKKYAYGSQIVFRDDQTAQQIAAAFKDHFVAQSETL